MRRHHRGGVRMEMSAAWIMHDTLKDSRGAGIRPISLWRVLIPDTSLRMLHVDEKWWVR